MKRSRLAVVVCSLLAAPAWASAAAIVQAPTTDALLVQQSAVLQSINERLGTSSAALHEAAKNDAVINQLNIDVRFFGSDRKNIRSVQNVAMLDDSTFSSSKRSQQAYLENSEGKVGMLTLGSSLFFKGMGSNANGALVHLNLSEKTLVSLRRADVLGSSIDLPDVNVYELSENVRLVVGQPVRLTFGDRHVEVLLKSVTPLITTASH